MTTRLLFHFVSLMMSNGVGIPRLFSLPSGYISERCVQRLAEKFCELMPITTSHAVSRAYGFNVGVEGQGEILI